jgi:hypothetical protein
MRTVEIWWWIGVVCLSFLLASGSSKLVTEFNWISLFLTVCAAIALPAWVVFGVQHRHRNG